MSAFLLLAHLLMSTAQADGVEVRVEAVNARTHTPLANYQVQMHPLRDFNIQSTQLQTNQLGIARMTAPRPDQYVLLIAPTQPQNAAQTQCRTVTVEPDQPLTVRFELGAEVPPHQRCSWLRPTETPPPRTDYAKTTFLRVQF
jgi:hypothetical protein